MIKRVSLLFLITGGGYGFSVWAFKFLALHADVPQLASIATVESLIQLMIGVIGFGMQTEAIRNISSFHDWQKSLDQAQQARLTLSLLFVTGAGVSVFFGHPPYLALAPLLALSADYAMYARGYPVLGAWIAFCRTLLPPLMAVAASILFPNHLLSTYLLATIVVYGATNLFISFFLKARWFYLPAWNSLSIYLKTIPLGIITLCFYFFGLGMLLFAQFFFSPEELIPAFLVLKFYLIFKGAVRVVQQAFLPQMKAEIVCIRVDKICVMMGLLFAGSVVLYPQTFISLFFGEAFAHQPSIFIWVGLASVVSSMFSSAHTRALLERRDVSFMKVGVASVVVALLTLVILEQVRSGIEIVGVSIFMGEMAFACGLAKCYFSSQQIITRFSFLSLVTSVFLIPFLFRWIGGESLLLYLLSFGLTGIILIAFTYKELASPAIDIHTDLGNN